MKRCPSCQQTFGDDAPDYCSNDGMRLVDEEAASYDPEKTVIASGLRGGEPWAVPPSAPQTQDQSPPETPGISPPVQGQPPTDQTPQPWQPPVDQPVWSPAQPQNWGGAPYPQPAAPGSYPGPYTQTVGGRSRAMAIAALVTGSCAATIMSIWVVRSTSFVFTSMLILGIFGIGLGVASLILALQKPFHFGGVPLAIAGLATGTAALVYYFTL